MSSRRHLGRPVLAAALVVAIAVLGFSALTARAQETPPPAPSPTPMSGETPAPAPTPAPTPMSGETPAPAPTPAPTPMTGETPVAPVTSDGVAPVASGAASPEGLRLEYQNAPLRAVLTALAVQTNRKITLPADMNETVTGSFQGMTADALLEYLCAANGYALERTADQVIVTRRSGGPPPEKEPAHPEARPETKRVHRIQLGVGMTFDTQQVTNDQSSGTSDIPRTDPETTVRPSLHLEYGYFLSDWFTAGASLAIGGTFRGGNQGGFFDLMATPKVFLPLDASFPLRPYGGIHLGVSWLVHEERFYEPLTQSFKDKAITDAGFGGGFMVGVDWMLTSDVALTFEYNFVVSAQYGRANFRNSLLLGISAYFG